MSSIEEEIKVLQDLAANGTLGQMRRIERDLADLSTELIQEGEGDSTTPESDPSLFRQGLNAHHLGRLVRYYRDTAEGRDPGGAKSKS